MRLTSRLLLGAAGIVTISLVMSGALTWLVIQGLEINNAQAALAADLGYQRGVILHLECQDPAGPLAKAPATGRDQACPGKNTPAASRPVYLDRLDIQIRALPATDRVLLLDGTEIVVWDNRSQALDSTQIAIGSPRPDDAGIFKIDFRVGAADFVGVGATLPVQDPLGAHWIILAQDHADIVPAGASLLILQLVGAGLVALIVAVGLALLLSRTITNPLTELARASEDIARGNYSRRVRLSGGPEVGTVGKAFNGMAEAVERARRLQRDFLANVSHELKTPLTSLIGFSQALLDGSLPGPEEQSRAATIINEEAHRVLRLAQELLDLARVESGQVSMHMQPVDLGAMLEQEVEFVRPRAEGRNLTLGFDLPPDIPPVRADPERLHQILDNMLDNAVKYALEGSSVEIGVEIRDNEVETSVGNSLSGGAPDPQRMFDRFYRAEPSRSTAAGGVGLGLAISRELAEAQRGRLWAEIEADGRLRMRLALERTSESRRSQVVPVHPR